MPHSPLLAILAALSLLSLYSLQGEEAAAPANAATNAPTPSATNAASSVTVGDPSRASDLPSELTNAYTNGAREITIRPGTYTLPATGGESIVLNEWKDAVIRATNVTVIFEELAHRPVRLRGCERVTFEGATLRFAKPSFTQARIIAMGKEAGGDYIDCKIDAGYPPELDGSLDIADAGTRLIKPGTGDFGCEKGEELASGLLRLHGVRGGIGTAAVNDWIFTRSKSGGSTIVQLDGCNRCIMRGLVLQNSGFASFFDTGGEGGNRYEGCRVMPGPKPEGATEEQLVGGGADGFHCAGNKVGPTIDHCSWEGLFHDDCIAIHGSFSKVLRAEGATLVLLDNRAGITEGEPVRISDTKGFYGEFTCTGVRTIKEKVEYLEMTVSQRDKPPVVITVQKESPGITGTNAAVAPGDQVRISTQAKSDERKFEDSFKCHNVRTVTREENFVAVTLDRDSGAAAESKASNPQHNGAGFRITGCHLGNCRSRGILVKADNGLIEGNVISGCGMSAVSIGPEFWWGESDYSRHVIVRGNTLSNNVLNGGGSGVILIHGDGAIGNADISIEQNLFEKNYGRVAINAEDTDGLMISSNRFVLPELPLPGANPRSIVDLRSCRNITLRDNLVEGGATNDVTVVIGKEVEGLTGNDPSGIKRR
jgi:hypothetical protein